MAVPQFLEPYTSMARTAIVDANIGNIKSLPKKVNPSLKAIFEYIEPDPSIFKKVENLCVAVTRAGSVGNIEESKENLLGLLADLEASLESAKPNEVAKIIRLV